MQGGPCRTSVKTCCLGEGEDEKILDVLEVKIEV